MITAAFHTTAKREEKPTRLSADGWTDTTRSTHMARCHQASEENVVLTDTAAPGTLKTRCQVEEASTQCVHPFPWEAPQTPLETEAAHWSPGAAGAGDAA